MSGISDGERLFGTDTFERAKSICRLSIDVLDCLRYFRMYVINGIKAGGHMCDFHESPGCLREAIFQLWSHCHEQDVPKGHDVWTLLPKVELANADNTRIIPSHRTGRMLDSFSLRTASRRSGSRAAASSSAKALRQ